MFGRSRVRYRPPSLRRQDQDSITRNDLNTRPHRGRQGFRSRPHEGLSRTQRSVSANVSNSRRSNESRKYPIGYNAMQDILRKEPDDIVLELLRENSGYPNLLVEADISPDKIRLIFQILSKACDSICSKENLLDLFAQTFCKPFINLLTTFIIKIKKLPIDIPAIKDFFGNLFEVCSLYQVSRPFESINSFEDIINATLLVLEGDSNYEKEVACCNAIKQIVDDTKNSFAEKSREEKERKRSGLTFLPNNEDELEPPDDFRKISVLPTRADIIDNGLPFLRKNVVEGRYKDANHYLDIQFRLLREDFVRPLREGLTQYRSNLKNHTQNRDLKVYRKVRVEKSELVKGEFVYYIKLNLTRKMGLENSKRLLYGNLLCFSRDNFQTLFFGYVFDRDINILKKGLIGVKFESKPIDFMGVYDMAESKAYFVAYQHVLEALQKIGDDNVPLPHYLLFVSNNLHHPTYMFNGMQYDLRVIKNFNLMKKPESSVLELLRQSESGKPMQPPDYLHPELSRVFIDRAIESWPTEECLSLDESQRAALYGAVTRQLAIIQGPPGTGKTYLGLKVTQILLHNSNIWNRGAQNPILVVCYTNHALDQFLEGMVSFTTSIVRVGSRSKSELISKFQINNLAREARRRRIIPDRIFRHNSKLNNEVRTRERQIETLLGELQEFKKPKGIFSYFALRHVIPQEFATILQKVGVENWLLNIGLDSNICEQLNRDLAAFASSNYSLEECVDKLSLDQEVDEDELWEDAKEFVEQEEMNRIIDIDVNVSSRNNVCKPSMDYLYDSTLTDINSEIDHLQQYIADEQYQDDLELFYRHDYLIRKKEMMLLCLDKLCNVFKKNSEIPLSSLNNIADMLQWPIPQRWQHYCSWVEKAIVDLGKRLPNEITIFQRKSKALVEMRNQEYLFIMRNSSVVGMTTTGAAQFSNVIQALGPKIVIIEEAAEILESHVIISLSSKCEHLILIGDHQQLRPSTTVYELAVKYKLETSLFERMIKNGVKFDTLQYQHRMRPSISKLLVPNIYPTLKDDDSVHGRDHITGLTKDIYFIDHQFFEDKHHDDNNSRENPHEASLVMALCRHLLLQGYDPGKITILTPYSGQFFLLRKLQRDEPICSAVKICVVDNFQGEENDIILLSLVRGNAEGNVGFLKIENRVCVALSRAKNGFYIVGNMSQLCMKSELWRKINQSLAEQDCVGPSITLKCSNHPEILTTVSNAQQFIQRSPEGGCLLQCSYNFESCGHACPRTCHVMDMDHKRMKCWKECLKKLCADDEHLCNKKCWEICGPCMRRVKKILPCDHTQVIACHINPADFPCPTVVEREIPDCKHLNKMPCHVKADTFVCSDMCDTRLDCGHQCRNKCHRRDDPMHKNYHCLERCSLSNKGCTENHPCIKKCYEECGLCIKLVEKKFPCGHTHSNVKCHENPEDIPCMKNCSKMMNCGHHCTRKCHEQCGGCVKIVEKTIPECGHKVKMSCGSEPTKKFCGGKCNMRLDCGHQCRNKCKDPCTEQCKELVPSTYRCPQKHVIKVPCHLQGTVAEEDSWMMCSDDCSKVLACGHICKGKCGDCFSGRVHIPCNEDCGKTLVCGHICKSPCSIDCPPCQNMCEFKCEHSRCREKCARPCRPCQMKCQRKCPHKSCEEKCGKVCSREPCEIACDKKLKCGHSCIGFCGDPCPLLCRVCDREELTKHILSGAEDEEDARFVMLEDCRHVIEVSALEQWLNLEMEKNEIGIKRCPHCKSGIFNSRRYYYILKKRFEDIEKVKRKYFNENLSSNFKNEIQKLLFSSEGKVLKFYDAERKDLLKSVGMDTLQTNKKKKKYFSSSEYGLVLFKAKVLTKGADILHNLNENFSDLNTVGNNVEKVLKKLVEKVLKIQDRVASQTTDEVTCELQRIEFLLPILKLQTHKQQNTALNLIYAQIDKLMDNTIKFDCSLEAKVKALLKESEKYIGGLGISNDERLQILKAMNLTQGHWYKCPNNHIYCITECGGAMEISTCPECGATIGGTNHNLQSDNLVASEMDGATYGAWSQQANLANYDPNIFQNI